MEYNKSLQDLKKTLVTLQFSSTVIKRVDCVIEDNIIEVEFLNGSKYVYPSVSTDILNGLMLAPSKGSYFNKNIKGKHTFIKLV